jgi:DNA-binding NarL/FixJ family response regulator
MTDARLAPMARTVLCMIADGLTDAEIGERLVRSPDTIHKHANRLCKKTRCRNRAELARYAVANGYVPSEWNSPHD